jgi:16S rRNA (guanine527-N7)-methyltransferase
MNSPETLHLVLERARESGFLGPGPVDAHLRHSEGFAIAAEDALGRRPRSFADLGTGGGIPGLVLAMRWPEVPGALVEVGQRRAAFLRESVVELGLADRIDVLEERGETVGQLPPYREQLELVTARSFAAPSVTAEIAAGIVSIHGVVVVSEPPEHDAQRWPTKGLGNLGFGPVETMEIDVAHFALLRKLTGTPNRHPRPVGRPAKRPLW